MTSPIHVTSEIGKLKTVMLHRPGREIENITPDSMERRSAARILNPDGS